MSSLYVYALTGAGVPPYPIEGGELESIDLGGIYAIAATMAERPAVSEAALRRQHDVIVSIAARADAVLPARFGSLVDHAELRRLVDLRRDVIRAALDLVRGREQMTVRIMGRSQVAAVPAAPAVTGTDYLTARRAAVSGKSLPGVEAVQRAVADLAAADRIEAGEAYTTVYHLIAAGTSESYRARIREAAAAIAPLSLRVSGPWPAFAFAPELIA